MAKREAPQVERLRPLDPEAPTQANDIQAIIVPVNKADVGERWSVIFTDSFQRMAHEKRMTLEMFRVRDKLLAHADFDNLVELKQSTIASDLEMHQSNVSRAIKGLIGLEFLKVVGKQGTANVYRINPAYVWRGRLRHIHGARSTYSKTK